MEISKKVYIKGDNAAERLQNLVKVAQEVTRGNFSEMTVRAWILTYNLDPHTLAPLGKLSAVKSEFCPTGAPKAISRRGGKNDEKA